MLRDKARFKKTYPTSKNVIQKQIIFASINGYFQGTPNNSQIIFYYVSNRRIEFRKDFENSHFIVTNAPITSQIFKIYIQSYGSYTHVANITFNSNEKNGIFSTLTGINHILQPGQSIYIQAPSTIDTNLSDITFALFGDLLA